MAKLRVLTAGEQSELISRGCYSESWDQIYVSECFSPSQLFACRLGGRVEIGASARIFNSTVSNYSLLEGAVVDSVTLLETNTETAFGNGVEVASLNECGGRSIKIFDAMTAQVAYIATVYRHRAKLITSLDAMAEAYVTSRRSTMGQVGRGSKVIGCGILRNLWIADGVTIEGSSSLSNGTLLSGAYFGADVKAHDFIAVEGSRVDAAATIERCFVGENAIISNGFTAVDSLFFASSHLENGEAASIFAGPYTVSHHKSSLLIAGMFSFFNAGSGSNQSNHLFKCGPVHQGVHLRGCKFGSSAYVMLPAVDGAFTSVMGSHSSHHDTSDFPFSYLVNKDGRSTLIPASNISSYGYMRDVEKWVKRDRRQVKRDCLSLDEHNPYIVGAIIKAINQTNILIEKQPDAASYIHNKVLISSGNLRRGLSLYNKAVASSLGVMLSRGKSIGSVDGASRWLDIAGQYISKAAVEAILNNIEQGVLSSFEAIDNEFRSFAASYDDHAYTYAYALLTELLGHVPSPEEVQQTITSSEQPREQIRAMAERDMQRDISPSMSVSYGIDCDTDEERLVDYKAVRGL